MAAPTNVRVEAVSQTDAVLRWTYAGSSGLSVYRSTNGISYSIITQDIVPTATSYTDTTLTAGVKYWYKMSDDLGATFSSVVTVYAHTCARDTGQRDPILMPRVDEVVTPENFNELADRIEVGLNRFISPDGASCIACISDGALVIDCMNYEGCDVIDIVTTADINSISLPNCEEKAFDMNFIIPPNTTVGIGGWPRGIGFTGDEAFTSTVSGGSSGSSIREKIIPGGINDNQNSGKSRPGTPGGSGERRGAGGRSATTGSGCTCTPGTNGELSIVICNPDGTANPTRSIGCSGATPGAKFLACGGRGPYTWSSTGSVTLSKASGSSTTVAPPTNSGSGVAGVAYIKTLQSVGCGHDVGTNHPIGGAENTYGCNDALIQCGSLLGGATAANFAFADSTCSCGTHSGHTISGSAFFTTVSCGTTVAAADCAAVTALGAVTDKRTAPMIAAGCVPCGLSDGNTVSVTDALGTVATVILRA